jgi:beta-glucosidase/6-phospho-beta-glucosidase/beta-galactosidase
MARWASSGDPRNISLSRSDTDISRTDFISLDAYSAPLIHNAGQDLETCARDHTANRPFPICVNGTKILPTGWDAGWNPIGKPTGYMLPGPLRTQLQLVWSIFNKPILISEFGLSPPPPPGGELSDNLYNIPQTEYLLSYLNEMLTAIWEDGVHVMGALVWTFLDDWEFGYNNKGFGLQFLNRTTQERVYRRSIFDIVDFVEGRRQH